MIAYLDPSQLLLLCELALAYSDQGSVHTVDLGSSIDVLNKQVVELRNHSL